MKKIFNPITPPFDAVPNNLTDIATRSHTVLSDIGTNTHAQIDTHLAAANPHSNSLNKTGDTMSGDLNFSGTAALEIADNAFAFKALGDNDAGLYFSVTNSAFELRDTLGAANNRFFTTGITRKGTKRVSTQFNKTDANLAVVTGLQVTLRAGLTYKFRALLFVDANLTGGSKYTVGSTGTLTATAIIYNINLLDNATSAWTITARHTALSGTSGQAGTTAGLCEIEGLITVNAGGDLAVAFAQNTASGTSSVLVGSTLEIEEV